MILRINTSTNIFREFTDYHEVEVHDNGDLSVWRDNEDGSDKVVIIGYYVSGAWKYWEVTGD